MIYNIIQEVNLENGSNHKKAVFTKNKDNELLQRVLKMTYDRVQYNYGVGVTTLDKLSYDNKFGEFLSLEECLDILENEFCTREVTGNAAIERLEYMYSRMDDYTKDLITKIINRDLKINFGKTLINKIWKNLITKPIYMRCDTYNKERLLDYQIKKHPGKPAKHKGLKFPAIVELKADGTYRETSVSSNVEFISRSGEEYFYPGFKDLFNNAPDGFFHGEMTIKCDDNIIEKLRPKLEKSDAKNGTEDFNTLLTAYNTHKEQGKEYLLPRGYGNGLLNSDDVPFENVIYELWDYITPEDYQLAGLKDKKNPSKTVYIDRLKKLEEIVQSFNSDQIRVIEYKIIQTAKDAFEFFSEKMSEGLEGAVLKDTDMLFEDGTSRFQLKMKLEIEVDVRVIGYKPGKPGSKREGKVGSIEFGNDENTIRGYASGYSDELLDEITENPDKYMGSIMILTANDLTKARGKKQYALSHPRFEEFRTDKTETDTLQRVLENKEMAIQLAAEI